MARRMYLHIYILFAIVAQEIFGTSLEEDIGDSTNSLVRQKRVINRLPGEDIPVPISTSAHTVNIRVLNKVHCIGTILSFRTAITAARCVPLDVSRYKVYSGTIYLNRGLLHNITEKRLHGNHPVQGQSFETGIALIYVHPTFNTGRNIAVIDLHIGPLLAGMEGTVRGWGTYYYGGRCESDYARILRAIEVPIISHRDCVNSFRGHFEITDSYFCTHDIHRQCGYTDTGTAFIIDNALAGIYVGYIQTGGNSHMNPDVYMMLQHADYHEWILRNIEH